MSETSKIIFCICILIVVYILTRKVQVWKIKKTYAHIIKDLEQKGAFNPQSAIELPYAKKSMFQFGIRDYRPKALEYLIINSIIGMTESGKYYLKNRETELTGSK
jgi:hypothetical protein